MSRASLAISWRLPWPCRACLKIQPNDQAARLSIYAHSYRDTIPQQSGPRARRSPCAQAVLIVACLGRIVAVSPAVSWPLLPAHARLLRALCHDTVHCIVTKCKMGSSPACCLHFFFFHIIFFFSFQLLENHQFFFSFSSRTK